MHEAQDQDQGFHSDTELEPSVSGFNVDWFDATSSKTRGY